MLAAMISSLTTVTGPRARTLPDRSESPGKFMKKQKADISFFQKARRRLDRIFSRRTPARSPLEMASTSDYLKTSFSDRPFSQVDFYEDGKVFLCCSTWLPTSVGSIKVNNIPDIWNSPLSQGIRESIHDGSFRYCKHLICPAIQSRSLPSLAEARQDLRYQQIIADKAVRLDTLPSFINLCNDASCNLSCPSCRTNRIIYSNGPEFAQRKTLQELITSQLFSQPTDREFVVNITGSGDPFASAVFREFLFNLDGEHFPNLSIQLQTNGVLLTPSNWKKISRLHKNIKVILISFDAATEDTYKITRRGGHWTTLIENVTSLSQLRKQGQLNFLRLDFVVQKANFREMSKFVELAKSFDADQITFSQVMDWGTWMRSEYLEQCIWRQDHPDYNEFLQVMSSATLADPIVNLGNLSQYRTASP
jgi:sulfatase maturation enzyme AslB (radical SAM superfamily)